MSAKELFETLYKDIAFEVRGEHHEQLNQLEDYKTALDCIISELVFVLEAARDEAVVLDGIAPLAKAMQEGEAVASLRMLYYIKNNFPFVQANVLGKLPQGA